MKKNDKLKKAMPEAVEAPAVGVSDGESKPIKKRKFSRKALIKVMFVISIVFIMVSLTYSWFTASNSASVNGLEIQVVDPNNLTPSGITSGGELNSVAGDGTSFFKPKFEEQPKKDAEGNEVLYDGKYHIYENVKTGKYGSSGDDVTSATADVKNVFYVDFSLSISGEHDIYLVGGTSVAAKDSKDSAFNPALRVAILKKNADEIYEPVFVWIPHNTSATIVYPNDKETGEGADGVSEETLTTEDDSFNDVNYAWGAITSENKIKIDTINGQELYRCVVWLDGNDEVCEDYSALGKTVNVMLKFLPEAVEEAETTGEGQQSDE